MHIVFRRSFVQRRTDTHPLTMWAIHTRYKTNIRGYVAGIDERGFWWCRYCRSIRMENARRGLYSDKRYRVRFILFQQVEGAGASSLPPLRLRPALPGPLLAPTGVVLRSLAAKGLTNY